MGFPTDLMASMRTYKSGVARGGNVPVVPLRETRLAATGTTESTTTVSLVVGAAATLLIGAANVRVRFLPATGGGSSVATTDPILPALMRYDWEVTGDDCFVAVEAADGAAAYEVWVWTSSP